MEERIKKLEAQVEELTRANEIISNEKNCLESECNRLVGEVTALSNKLESSEQTKDTYYKWYKEEEWKKITAELMLTSLSGMLDAYIGKKKP